jgi:CRISPR-associated exonuclease Cas4
MNQSSRVFSDDELLPLSGLQHLAFCERQWGLIHIEQVWADSADTLRGEFFHERVDTAGYTNASGVQSERSVRITSYELGLYGVADIVEFSIVEPMVIRPVEYKVGSPKVASWDRIQLSAQAICLEEMYQTSIKEGALYYGSTRRRERIEISQQLRDEVIRLSGRAHSLFAEQVTPLPRKRSRCNRCSLRDLCVPELAGMEAAEYWESFGECLGRYDEAPS